jgi:glycine cleavage system H lipoate-binding protein
MPKRDDVNHSPPCLWMSAGVVTYRLCDRDFDCDECPLDAALRNDSRPTVHTAGLQMARGLGSEFPEDRRYTSGHWWVLTNVQGGDSVYRCGLDLFAAAIIGRCDGVSRTCDSGHLARGESLCEIDFGLGRLQIAAPISGTVTVWNSALDGRPEEVVLSPYDEGWLVELVPSNMCEMNDLLTAQVVRQKSQYDLQRLRRRIATQTLADDAHCLGRTSADGGELITDVRQMLGGSAYIDTIGELIH